MKKTSVRLLSILVILCVLLSTSVIAAPEGAPMPGGPGGPGEIQEEPSVYFDDVAGDGVEAVDYLYENGILIGVKAPTADSSGLFDPDAKIIRGDFVKMLVSALDITAEQNGLTFSDVPADAYYAEHIAIAASLGLVNGIGHGLFAPENYINNQEVAAILYRAVENGILKNVSLVAGDGWELNQMEPSSWAKISVQALVASGVMEGTAEPTADATRLDIAKMLAKILQTNLESKAAPEAYDEVLVVVHTNDTHGYIQNEAKVKAVADYYKGTYGSNVITMSAGDIYAGGAAVAHYYKGEAIREVMDAAGYDYVVPGNNDFNLEDKDPGQNELLAKEATYQTIAANLYYKNDDGGSTGELVFPAFDVVETEKGVKVGIFGLALLGRKSDDYFQSDDIEAAAEMVSFLKEQDCSIIIALGHKGWKGEPDPESITNRDSEMAVDYGSAIIADETEGLDALIDGHSHSIINDGDGWISANTGCIVTQAGEKGNVVGVLKMYIKDGIVVKSVADIIDEEELNCFEPDATVQELVDSAYARFDEDTKKPVGETIYNLNAARLSGNEGKYGIRTDETNMGDLCADALRWKLNADVATMSAGGIRASIPAGEITLGDWFSVFSNGGFYKASDITGQELLESLAGPLSSLPNESPGFIQVSGVKFGFVLGDGIITIVNPTVNGEPLDPEKIYRVAQFDGEMSTEESEGDDSVTGMDALADMMVDYLAEGDYTIYPDTAAPDARMVLMDSVPDDAISYEVEVQAGMMP